MGDFGLLKVFFRPFKHQVGDAETEDFIGFFKKGVSLRIVVVEVFAHTYELGALARKNISLHRFYYCLCRFIVFE